MASGTTRRGLAGEVWQEGFFVVTSSEDKRTVTVRHQVLFTELSVESLIVHPDPPLDLSIVRPGTLISIDCRCVAFNTGATHHIGPNDMLLVVSLRSDSIEIKNTIRSATRHELVFLHGFHKWLLVFYDESTIHRSLRVIG